MPYMALYKLKLLDEFEERIDLWTFADFEKRLIELWRGATYHDAKGIINAAHKERRWPRVVKRYLLSNYKVFGNVSSELERTFAEVLAAMNEQERAEWGLLPAGSSLA
ncbi:MULTISPECIES: hypothetical protein [Pseudomonas]|uniref:hypothetical protein n=1 Tax=Pseudomonas TaxID=286 RepID=UPI00104F9067|nr:MULTISPECIES: hypothetical protein [Pseudomonas]TCP79348.1 hypothetical protein EC849_10155 [Pseudomonas putida]HDS0935321.1 hypothetical protein [Pseudomonas putida]HDS1784519.1 hypothetical protein [Pseudomonas putida]